MVFVTDETMNVFELENKRPFYHVRKVAREACVNHSHGVTVWCQFPTQKTTPFTQYPSSGNFHFSAADYLLKTFFDCQWTWHTTVTSYQYPKEGTCICAEDEANIRKQKLAGKHTWNTA